MKTIPLSEIVIAPGRQRREFNPDTLEELKRDIEENGLYNAIVLREEERPGYEGTMAGHDLQFESVPVLVQGERRYRAMADILSLGGQIKHDGELCPPGHVPYTTRGDLDPLRAMIAEFHENMHRDNLTWQEESDTAARIMALRTELAAQLLQPAPTTTDIMNELADVPLNSKSYEQPAAHRKVREQLIVAKHMDDPEVKAAKTLKDAYKLVLRKESLQRNETLAKTVGLTFTKALHQMHNADAVEWLPKCHEGQFDVILTDPPYGMDADEFGDSGGKAAGAHRYVDDDETYEAVLSALWDNAYRIAKPQAHLYVFCDIDRFYDSRAAFENKGWWVHRTPLIWHKPNGSRVPWPENGPQRKYELILYAVKGKRPVNGIFPDVISVPTDQNLGHSAQKPVALYMELLKRSARAGDTVLDPFAGSGPLLRAAHEMKCVATLVEKDQASYGIILNRAKELK